MKNILRIFAHVKSYWGFATLNIIFNILSVLFSLFSLAMVVPILRLLFGIQELVIIKPEFHLNTAAVLNSFNYYVSKVVIEFGKQEALLFICFLVIVLFFLKNLGIFVIYL